MDPFLDKFDKRQRTIILSAFGQAVREGKFSRNISNPLVSLTVRTAMDNVSQTFQEFDRPDPRLDREGQLSRLLSKQLKGYKEKDPRAKQQKAILLSIARHMAVSAVSDYDKALANLCIGAIFFCMRSCKYLSIPQAFDKKTKLLKLKNFRFFKDGKEIPHNSTDLFSSDVVSITFKDQKNREKHETVHLHRSEDPVLCLVKAWANTIHRIKSNPGSSKHSPVNSFLINKRFYLFKSKNITDALRKAVSKIGEDSLGFKKEEIGTHSIRSGGAMALYLAQIQVFTIKLIVGRWKSDAFLWSSLFLVAAMRSDSIHFSKPCIERG